MNYQDAMAICRVYGPPDLFVTFTCNSKWREIADALRYEPVCLVCAVARVVLYTIEFQKRGLPHIHCLMWSRPSPNKNVAKKLFTGKEPGDDNCGSDGSAEAADQDSPSKDA
uniref:Helitron helicase-like domain-containing protein n=1 Tax=Setaria italica TaxID=4555 RepID=K3Y063_SETIT